MSERKRCCCNCDHRLKDTKHCDIDGAYINYITCFDGWCHHWTNKVYCIHGYSLTEKGYEHKYYKDAYSREVEWWEKHIHEKETK